MNVLLVWNQPLFHTKHCPDMVPIGEGFNPLFDPFTPDYPPWKISGYSLHH